MSCEVCPFRSSSVVQSSSPTVCASTKTKSQKYSVPRAIVNATVAPPAGTSITCCRRW